MLTPKTVTVYTIWVSLEKLDETLLQKRNLKSLEIYLFGKKSPHLQPILNINKWKGKLDSKKNYKHIKLKTGIELWIKENNVPKVKALYEINNYLLEKKIFKKLFNTQPRSNILQDHPFCLIDIELEEEHFSSKFNKEEVDAILDLLFLVKRKTNYNMDVYEEIGLANRDKSNENSQSADIYHLTNFCSLDSCFLTISPKTALVIRGNGNPNKRHILPNTLQSVCMVAICFVGYSELLLKLAEWEGISGDGKNAKTAFMGILPLCNLIKGKDRNNDKKDLLTYIRILIEKLIEYNYLCSHLLQFHMSYITSSAVAQRFFNFFSKLSGLEEIHRSLVIKLQNCERLLNNLIDYHQFREIEDLKGNK